MMMEARMRAALVRSFMVLTMHLPVVSLGGEDESLVVSSGGHSNSLLVNKSIVPREK